MADQEPPENNSIESADVVADGTEVPNLPAKIRVHALAKMLGLTSKQVIAKATELGTALSSAHATLHRDVAREVYAALSGASEPAAPVAPEGRTEAQASRPRHPRLRPTRRRATQTLAHTEEPVLSPEPKVADKDEPVQETSIGGPTGLFTSPEQHTPLFAPPEPVADTVAAPLFLQPVAPAPADEDADDEPVRPRRRRARRGAAAKDIDEQTVEKTAEKTSGKAPETTSDKAAGAEAPAEQVDEAPARDTGSDGGRAQGPDDDDQDEHPRRRRRGRRGRGRGRGDSGENDQHDDTSSEHEEKSGKDDDRTETGPAADSATTGTASRPRPTRNRRTRPRRTRTSRSTPTRTTTPMTTSTATARRVAVAAAVVAADRPIPTPTRRATTMPFQHRRARARAAAPRRASRTRCRASAARRASKPSVSVAGTVGTPAVAVPRSSPSRSSWHAVSPSTGSWWSASSTSGAHAGHDAGRRARGRRPRRALRHDLGVGVDGRQRLPRPRAERAAVSMEAAFIDIGRGRNGVLYAGEVNWEAAGLGGNSRKIEQALKPGDRCWSRSARTRSATRARV